jgi:hypothetical protein
MSNSAHESTAAWRELLETLGGLDRSFLSGDRAVTDDRHIADGYRMLATTLGVAFDTYLFADPGRPMWMEINSPVRADRRWGGDNTDAYYFMCPVEPSPGAWSDKILAIVRDDDLEVDALGNFSFDLGPTPEAAVLMTRDYQADPRTGRPVVWRIEALDEPEPFRHGDAETAAALRASAAWMRTMFAILPLAVGVRSGDAHTLGHETSHAANEFADPYQVPDANFGWSARDACYAYGSFVLEDDEALVITHRPPACRFWNLVVWNQFMATPGVARCAQFDQRPHRGAQRRRFGDDGVVAGDDRSPQLAHDARLSAGQPRVSLVPGRRGSGSAAGAPGQGVGRADDDELTRNRRTSVRARSSLTRRGAGGYIPGHDCNSG